MRTTDDGPDVRSTFCIIAGIVRGAWLISRAFGAARTEGGHRGAGTARDTCDIGWQLLGIPWSYPVNKVEEVRSTLNSRPARIMVASSYVWLSSTFASNVNTWALSRL